jgi:hypothetical protein
VRGPAGLSHCFAPCGRKEKIELFAACWRASADLTQVGDLHGHRRKSRPLGVWAGSGNSASTHDALIMASLVRKITAPLQAPERSDSRGDPDRLRSGLIRYAGYANEVGESFRPLVPRAAVNATYVAATGYVMADAAWRANTLPTDSPRSPMVEVVDTLIWQGLASIIFPGEPHSVIESIAANPEQPCSSCREYDAIMHTGMALLARHGHQSRRVGGLAPDYCGLSRANHGGSRLHPADRAPNRLGRGLGPDDLPQTLLPGLPPGLGEAHIVKNGLSEGGVRA